jgi:hypothetical protein
MWSIVCISKYRLLTKHNAKFKALHVTLQRFLLDQQLFVTKHTYAKARDPDKPY